MALSYAVGSKVALVAHVIHGTVLQANIVGSDIQYLVSFTNEHGDAQESWFSEADLDSETAAAAALTAAAAALTAGA